MTQNHLRQAMEEDADSFVSSTERTVYLQMMWWADKKGVIRHSQRDIAVETLLHRATVNKNLESLIGKELLRQVRPGRYAIPNVHYEGDNGADNGNRVASPVQIAMLKLSRDGGRTVVVSPYADAFETDRDTMQAAIKEGLARADGYQGVDLVWRILPS